ncbi:hypothetical protein [Rhizohabitans arisaemae]|uniref:hypothetical protein n=1 Tax=Rhizohabitans arisaemae TaxID=2720610 RepID=UPI0024B17C43|nr:hypothetical protein [Rhizohabitans arisaemae]
MPDGSCEPFSSPVRNSKPTSLAFSYARLIAAQANLDIGKSWGSGQIASAGGLRFVVSVQNRLDGHQRPTSEHHFQAQKFVGTRHADLIRRARTPLRAAEPGRAATPPDRCGGTGSVSKTT